MRAELLTALFVVAMFLTSACMVYGDDPGSPSLSASMSNGMATIDYSLPSSAHAYPSVVVAVPLDSYRSSDITVLMTGRGGPPNSEPANIQGLVDHLSAELENLGSSSKVSTIDEGSLSAYLATEKGTLVIASQVDLATSATLEGWVEDGGLLVAIGPGCVPFLGPGGSLELGTEEYEFDGTTLIGSLAYDLGLRTVYPVNGLVVDDVLARSGTVLGHTTSDGSLTTSATVPLGQGKVLVMGGPMDSPFLASMEDVYAWDLARLLETGAPWVAGPIYHERVQVPAQGVKGTITMDLMGMSVRVAVISLDDSHALFRGLTIEP